jgi:hypothetical protein
MKWREAGETRGSLGFRGFGAVAKAKACEGETAQVESASRIFLPGPSGLGELLPRLLRYYSPDFPFVERLN